MRRALAALLLLAIPGVLQDYLGALQPPRAYPVTTAEARRPAGQMTTATRLGGDGEAAGREVTGLYAAGPWASDRRDVARHELGHLLNETLLGGAPPGTLGAVVRRLAEVGQRSPAFEMDTARAYERAGGVTRLTPPPVTDETLPIPLHEYLASVWHGPNGTAPSTGRDAAGRRWDAKGLVESLARYQLSGP